MDHKIISKDIDSLIFAEYNPRQLTKDQYKHLKDSIDRFGLVDPIIVNKNKDRKNIIVGGHQRVKVAKDMNIKEVPVLEVDLTYDRERELNVRLNANTGEWDTDILANMFELDELQDWGFDDIDLKLFEDEEIKEGLTDDDDVPEVEESICKVGDLWILGEHRLLCGDATKKEDVDKLMDGDKADMVFTDPPYGINYQDLKKNHKKIENDIDATNVLNILNNYTCPMFVCCNWRSMPNFIEIINNVDFKACIVWDKGSRIQNLDKFAKQHEFILYAGEYGGKKTIDVDVWQINRQTMKEHPTAKPVELVIRAIKTFKGNVIDPFLGSGSTLIACEKTNRKCYGMELDPHYCDVIIKRWEDYTGKVAKLDGKT